MVFTPRPLQIPNMRTDYSAENAAFSNLGQTLGSLPGDIRKEQLNAQKQQLLGQIGSGSLDYDKAGRALIALGDTTAGAALLGLGQKQQERDLEKAWMGGGAGSTAAVPQASLGTPNEVENRFVGGVQKAGLTNPVGLAAVAAYGKSESGYNPGNVNKTWSDPSESGEAGTSGGIMSWRADRLQNLQAFARQRGEQGNGSPETQAAFLAQEDPTLVPRLNAAKTPQEANQIMADAWRFAGYNRPGQGEYARREGLTGAYAQRYAGQPAQPQQPVQVAENEADVQRLEQAQADAANRPAAGAANAQGFAIPGTGEVIPQSISTDPAVRAAMGRYVTAPTERTRAAAKAQLDLAVSDAKQKQAINTPTDAQKNYEAARRQGYQGSLLDYQKELRAQTNVNVDTGQKLETAYASSNGKAISDRFSKIVEEGDAANAEVGTLARIRELGGQIKNIGSGAALQGWLAERGIKVGPNVSEIEAYGALIDKLTPQQRIAGAGATSDYDARMFKNSLPGLMRTPGGNELILSTLEALNTYKRQRGDIVAEAMANNEKPPEVIKRLKELPDPFAAFKEARKGGAPTPPSPAEAPAGYQPQQGATPPRAPAPPTMPEGARQAPDGKFYVPDPARPGKYLQVQ